MTSESSLTPVTSNPTVVVSHHRPRAGSFGTEHDSDSNVEVNVERSRRTQAWSHSPVVLAMLSDNRMSKCADVREIYNECLASNSKDRICNTASYYFQSCMDQEK
mmetsp:Transcript_16340/g.21497  ORF Transcript_16340/g.21497 Transcript_16340/m.21497 type:complete len:105 (+) Transcript_16340:75-389(+)|eukprot:CAMPEP_0195266830 /NCGR_PEP_ID=MMETSP0706-20130129/12241_1 /TAXON_ID=33640 /ORGANISM="Asterionellopsis glacialis, Strain CCMP134" /LENGTH=104 /DNA_ID=CAMNT_0040321491 /DNA_START=52 /DNA_END=366 /DNA_ORIENTATION=-